MKGNTLLTLITLHIFTMQNLFWKKEIWCARVNGSRPLIPSSFLSVPLPVNGFNHASTYQSPWHHTSKWSPVKSWVLQAKLMKIVRWGTSFPKVGWSTVPITRWCQREAWSLQPDAVPPSPTPITTNRIAKQDKSCHPVSEKASRLKRLCLDGESQWKSCVLACSGLPQAQVFLCSGWLLSQHLRHFPW